MNDNAVLVRTPISFKDKKIVFVAPHPDDDAIGCGALLFYLSKIDVKNRPKSIHVAYAVSGFVGVSDCFLEKSGYLTDDYKKQSIEEQRLIKSEIRKKEAISFCDSLGLTPVFWNLPFYEKQQKNFNDNDIDIVSSSINQIDPDIIFLIDESNDPHGTHGFVRQIVFEAIKKTSFNGLIVGYRVWQEEGYSTDECNFSVFFDESMMKKKEKLISFYKSQLKDPAYPCKYHSFIKLVKHTNSQMAKLHGYEKPYAECYKIFK